MRAQRVTGAGSIAPGWPAGGLILRDGPFQGTYDQHPLLAVTPSGPDHFFAAWYEDSETTRNIWLQRFHRDGTLAAGWPVSAKLIHAYPYAYSQPDPATARMIGDGSTGAYLAWIAGNSGPYGVHVLEDGSVAAGWNAEGSVLTDPGAVLNRPWLGPSFDIANGPDAGLIVTWRDGRDSGAPRLRARWLRSDGSPDPNQSASRTVTPPTSENAVVRASSSDGQGGI